MFAAEWTAAHAQGMTVVQHTPDICWVGAGWKPTEIGQPKQVESRFPSFRTRLKRSPRLRRTSCRSNAACSFRPRTFTELVLWGTLVSGRVLPEQSRFDPGKEQSDDLTEGNASFAAGRRLTAGSSPEALKHRLRAAARNNLPASPRRSMERGTSPLRTPNVRLGMAGEFNCALTGSLTERKK